MGDSNLPTEGSVRPAKPDRSGQPSLTPAIMVQLLRGELSRSDTWRTRLDTTTNWALTVSAAVLSVSFADARMPHGVLLIGIWMVISFLMIEARRYRYYDLWIHRVRLLEDGYFAPMIRGEPHDPDAMRELAHALARPRLRLTLPSAVGTRINRTYGPMLAVLVVTWFVKVQRHPKPATTIEAFFQNAAVGLVSGELMTAVMTVFAFAVLVVVFFAMIARQPLGEMRSRPRSDRLALWNAFLRPYGAPTPRKRRPRRV